MLPIAAPAAAPRPNKAAVLAGTLRRQIALDPALRPRHGRLIGQQQKVRAGQPERPERQRQADLPQQPNTRAAQKLFVRPANTRPPRALPAPAATLIHRRVGRVVGVRT